MVEPEPGSWNFGSGSTAMGVGRKGRGPWPPPVFWKLQQKKVVFSILRCKKQISPLLAPSGKILEKSPSGPPGKNPSDAHVHSSSLWGNRVVQITQCFQFSMEKSWNRSPKLLDVGAGAGAKKFRCLEPEPVIWVPAPQPWLKHYFTNQCSIKLM